MKRLRAVGSTAMAMLEHFWDILRKQGIAMVICGIEDELQQVMTGSGLRQQIGELNIFYADNRLLQSTELALARAWSIVEMMERQGDGREPPEAVVHKRVVAGDLMSTRCIRFGNQHQLREAVWMMSELYRHARTVNPEPLFLQTRDGKLAGELSPWRILRALGAGIGTVEKADLDDDALGELLRRDFQKPIGPIARRLFEHADLQSSFPDLLDLAVRHDLQLVPVCDSDNRIKGLVSQDDLLRYLDRLLVDLKEEIADAR